MSNNPIDRMYDALAKGDIAATQACFTPDARIWHCFDGMAQDLAEASKGWQTLVNNTKGLSLEDVRRLATPNGFFQQHVFSMVTPNDARKSWHVCVIVKTEGELISRFDEYIDRAGSFTPA